MFLTRAPVRELPAEPRSCNDFPGYYNIPINRFFWLGAHDVTSQDRSVTDMLHDGKQGKKEIVQMTTHCTSLNATVIIIGIRLLDLNLCSSPK